MTEFVCCENCSTSIYQVKIEGKPVKSKEFFRQVELWHDASIVLFDVSFRDSEIYTKDNVTYCTRLLILSSREYKGIN